MWTFDGEEWIEDAGADRMKSESPEPVRIDEFTPELQVIEIVPLPRPTRVPLPFTMP